MPLQDQIIEICLQYEADHSRKFWSGRIMRYDPSCRYTFTATFGRIGTSGQTIDYNHPSALAAFGQLLTKLKEKATKGYVLFGATISAWEDFYEDALPSVIRTFIAKLKNNSTTTEVFDSIFPRLRLLASKNGTIVPTASSNSSKTPINPFVDGYVPPLEGFFTFSK